MKNQTTTFIEKELLNEPHVAATDIIAEIEPLLYDYFIGDIFSDGQSLTYRLPNGQKFKLTVTAC